jgi:hypothetical protein
MENAVIDERRYLFRNTKTLGFMLISVRVLPPNGLNLKNLKGESKC